MTNEEMASFIDEYWDNENNAPVEGKGSLILTAIKQGLGGSFLSFLKEYRPAAHAYYYPPQPPATEEDEVQAQEFLRRFCDEDGNLLDGVDFDTLDTEYAKLPSAQQSIIAEITPYNSEFDKMLFQYD